MFVEIYDGMTINTDKIACIHEHFQRDNARKTIDKVADIEFTDGKVLTCNWIVAEKLKNTLATKKLTVNDSE